MKIINNLTECFLYQVTKKQKKKINKKLSFKLATYEVSVREEKQKWKFEKNNKLI